MYFIIPFLVIATGFANALDCSQPRSEVCDSPYYVSRVPDSEEEFKSICRDVNEAFECWLNYEGKCGDDPAAAGKIYRQQNVAKGLCEDYSLFTQEIKDNFDCIKSFMYGGPGCEAGKDLITYIQKLMEILVKGNGYEIKPEEYDDHKHWCFNVLMKVGCNVVMTQKRCGKVKGLDNLVIKGYQMFHRDCSEDIEKYSSKFIHI